MTLTSAPAQEQAREHPDSGEFERARKLLPEAADEPPHDRADSSKAQELLEQAETLDRNVAFMSHEGNDSTSRKLMRYQQRTTSQRRKRWRSSAVRGRR